MASRAALPLLVASLVLAACESADPEGSGPGAGVASGVACAADDVAPLAPPQASCAIPATDYTPRDPSSAGTRYPACISDDDAYHPFQADVPSNARLAAIVAIGRMLHWDGAAVPTPAEFEQARLLYTQPEGVDSRVQRREDIHYPAAPKKCQELAPDEIAAHPDRCVGPAKIIPLLNDAFQKGAAGVDPVVQAARVEAALVWFMYVSYYKEAFGCATELNQCDSTSAYWAGQQDRSKPPTGGLGLYVEPLSKEAYERGWDAVLAMRCWRDADNPQGNATNVELMNRMGDQIDRAGDHAIALIVRHRLQNLGCAAAWETVKILGGVIDRAATARDPAKAAVLRAELAKADAAAVDAKAAIAAIEALFPCP